MRRVEGVATSLLLATVVAGPGAALASKSSPKPAKLRTVSATQSIAPNGGVASAIATCPRKFTAVGGGFATGTPVAMGPTTFVHESARVGRTQWRASASVPGPVSGGTITSYVYCRKPALKLSTAVATATAPAFTMPGPPPTNATATCPGKRKAVSGGFELPSFNQAGSGILVQASFAASKNSWTTTALEAVGASASFANFAYCAQATKAPTAKSGAGTIPAQPATPPSGSAVTAPCAAKTKLFAGGFQSTPRIATTTTAAIVWESRALDAKTWQASAFALGAPGFSLPLTAFGYCSR